MTIDNRMPDATLYFEIDPEIGMKRINDHKGREVNRLDLENLEFHRKVREGYQLLSRKYSNRIIEIDASQPLQKVYEIAESKIMSIIQDLK